MFVYIYVHVARRPNPHKSLRKECFRCILYVCVVWRRAKSSSIVYAPCFAKIRNKRARAFHDFQTRRPLFARRLRRRRSCRALHCALDNVLFTPTNSDIFRFNRFFRPFPATHLRIRDKNNINPLDINCQLVINIKSDHRNPFYNIIHHILAKFGMLILLLNCQL